MAFPFWFRHLQGYQDSLLNLHNFRYTTSKGRRDLDHTMQYGVGLYVVNLDVRYKSIEDRTFQSRSININFICYIEKPESRSESSFDIIKSNFGASSLVSFSGDNKIDDNLCVRIVKDVDLPIIEVEGAPRIEKGSLDMSLRSMPLGGGEPTGYIPIFIGVSFAQTEFTNRPVNVIAESTAKNVRAKITYLRDDHTVIRTVRGRWAGDGKTDDEEIVDLLSNGKPRTLYLAMRYEEKDYEKQLYMYGMETTTTYFFNRHTDDTYRLYDKKVVAKVEIIGERVRLTKNFILYNYDKLGIEVI